MDDGIERILEGPDEAAACGFGDRVGGGHVARGLRLVGKDCRQAGEGIHRPASDHHLGPAGREYLRR